MNETQNNYRNPSCRGLITAITVEHHQEESLGYIKWCDTWNFSTWISSKSKRRPELGAPPLIGKHLPHHTPLIMLAGKESDL